MDTLEGRFITYERKNIPLKNAKRDGNGDVEFGIVVYWYQAEAVDVSRVKNPPPRTRLHSTT
ncbi:MAG TPA: hypothetical protein VIL33_04560 [Rhodothermia bacterium]